MNPAWRRQFSWREPLDGRRYFVAGVVLTIIKQFIDRGIAAAFGRSWSFYNDVIPTELLDVAAMPARDALFYASIATAAVPFIFVGVLLTARRLATLGIPIPFVLFFFAPIPANLIFFVAIAFAPPAGSAKKNRPASRPAAPPVAPDSEGALAPVEPDEPNPWAAPDEPFRPVGLQRLAPENNLLNLIVALFLPLPVVLGLGWLVVEKFQIYGWGLFVGLPFFGTMSSVLIYGARVRRTYNECLLVAGAWLTVGFLVLLVLLMEGILCILFALPIVLPIALLGATIGWSLQWGDRDPAGISRMFLILVGSMPAIIAAEAAGTPRIPLHSVATAVEIDAPPEVVWEHVIDFPPLPLPDDFLLANSGIAYPLHAKIDGRGPGATRHCVFSTGAFVEPITAWDEPRLLRFDVTGCPPPMTEWNPFGEIHPPHLDGVLVSRQGQFLLERLPGNRTRLEGTTWFTNRMWPSSYWQLWSEDIIGRIHLQVLRHVKRLAERDR